MLVEFLSLKIRIEWTEADYGAIALVTVRHVAERRNARRIAQRLWCRVATLMSKAFYLLPFH